MKIKYLIVEDHEDLRKDIANELQKSSITEEVLVTDSGEEALAMLGRDSNIGMVVLDLDLTLGVGKMYGMQVLSMIREFSTVPIVILTSDEAPERQTEAMAKGATGYMHKKWFTSEIQIRQYLETVLERERSEAGEGSGRYSFEGWTIDAVHRRLLNPDDAEVTLTTKEFDLLLMFVENPRTVLQQEALINKFSTAAGKDPRAAFAKLLSRLRGKIDKGRKKPFILNMHGKGFLFTPLVTPEVRE